ncbi:MAG: ABC transporter substrate-binding protein [Rhizobiales bacterium 65-79]|jgi:branched-chain amino acid transport system substrate-binding protein|nr:ABC transporter substrate-binding protein [Hyphomicrobiales bacterium]OJU06986.1 MAG: ABC transporter substrate-binding protein [Rhizobiales bacterium 65-79]
MRKPIHNILPAAALASAAALCMIGTAHADKVTIGVLAPLTGPAASDGQEFERGVKWAVEEQNAKGGVAGHTFEVDVADVKDGSAANVTSAVERLLGTDGVQVILTGYASLSMFETDLMKEADMPYLSAGPSPQFAKIVTKDPDSYWCCWSYTADFKGYVTDVLPTVEGLAKDGAITLRNKKVAVISSDNPYSKGISEGMKPLFKAAGWTITVDEMVPYGEVNDWSAILAKVRQDPPDLVINADYLPGNSALFLKQFLQKPTNSLVFLQYAPSVPEFVKLTGEQSNGVLYDLIGGPLDSPKWPRAQTLLKGFKDKYGVDSGAYGVGLYEMTNLYFKALAEVGDPTKHEEIGKAIGRMQVDSVAGPIAFDPKTHVALQDDDHVPVSFWQIWDGKRILVKPDKYAAAKFRLPPWMSK